MTEAAQEHSFHGAFVYERTGSFTTHYVWHMSQGDESVERLVQTDGLPQEWVRRQGSLTCSTTPAGPQGGLQDALVPVEESGHLDQWYSIQVLGETRVASRPVSVVALFPRDGHRYSHEFYIDNETGLLLKSLLISDRQTLLERFQFTTFELDAPPAANLRPGEDCVEVVSAASDELIHEQPLQPAWLPQGFVMTHQDAWRADSAGSTVMALAYTDGLARFTIFVEPLADIHLAEDLRAQLGPTVAVSRRLPLEEGNYLATVVGEIPAATAERILASYMPEPTETRP